MGSTRKKIGLCYTRGYESSTALAIYIQNIIKGLKLLPDALKPQLYLFYTNTAPIIDVQTIDYPYIEYVYVEFNPPYVQLTIGQRIVNRILVTIGLKPFYKPQKDRIQKKVSLDVLYPNWISDPQLQVKKVIHWVIDFQEIHLPHFFSAQDLTLFFDKVESLAYSRDTVVVSSWDAKKDFTSMHADYTCDLRVLNFVSGFDYQSVPLDHSVVKTYGIDQPYFITPNQFWPHKNHIVILKALKRLIDQGYSFQVVFTGTPSSYRDSTYGEKLASYVGEHKLGDHVKFLGFLPRADMLNLVRQSRAIIQPSLFEGWSTLVEESKALSKFIVLSDLSVHREQIKDNCAFFDPQDEVNLSDVIKTLVEQEPLIQVHDYQINVKRFSDTLVDLFELNR